MDDEIMAALQEMVEKKEDEIRYDIDTYRDNHDLVIGSMMDRKNLKGHKLDDAIHRICVSSVMLQKMAKYLQNQRDEQNPKCSKLETDKYYKWYCRKCLWYHGKCNKCGKEFAEEDSTPKYARKSKWNEGDGARYYMACLKCRQSQKK